MLGVRPALRRATNKFVLRGPGRRRCRLEPHGAVSFFVRPAERLRTGRIIQHPDQSFALGRLEETVPTTATTIPSPPRRRGFMGLLDVDPRLRGGDGRAAKTASRGRVGDFIRRNRHKTLPGSADSVREQLASTEQETISWNISYGDFYMPFPLHWASRLFVFPWSTWGRPTPCWRSHPTTRVPS